MKHSGRWGVRRFRIRDNAQERLIRIYTWATARWDGSMFGLRQSISCRFAFLSCEVDIQKPSKKLHTKNPPRLDEWLEQLKWFMACFWVVRAYPFIHLFIADFSTFKKKIDLLAWRWPDVTLLWSSLNCWRHPFSCVFCGLHSTCMWKYNEIRADSNPRRKNPHQLIAGDFLIEEFRFGWSGAKSSPLILILVLDLVTVVFCGGGGSDAAS